MAAIPFRSTRSRYSRTPSDEDDLQSLIARRQQRLGPELELSYDNPVHVVRGEGVWLIDDTGRSLLDAYNNVPSVGHCHPTVDHLWGFEAHDVVPDIVTLGKPIGNGLSMAAVVTTPDIVASLMKETDFFSTTGGERDGGCRQPNARIGGTRRNRGTVQQRAENSAAPGLRRKPRPAIHSHTRTRPSGDLAQADYWRSRDAANRIAIYGSRTVTSS